MKKQNEKEGNSSRQLNNRGSLPSILNASLADWERELNLPSGTLCRWNGDGDALVMIPGTRK